jgi:membrane fusion protein, heavy metal efflux system
MGGALGVDIGRQRSLRVHDMLSSSISRASQALPRRVQFAILAVVAFVAIAAIVAVPLLRDRSRSSEAIEPATATAPGTFRPSPQQWAGFTLATVALVTFRSEHVTDGKIAINDDRTTPVFSPYSGRVTRLVAKPGDFVERGAPLLEVEASEFVQAQNDLAAAAAALGKARSQLHLAETTERRQRDLYEAKAGALKDWQQAQSDLAGARNDLRSAEAALAAVRNRLRILGRSEQQIDAVETTGKMNPEATVTAPIDGTVLQRKVGLGQYIAAAAADPIFTIGDLSTVWLVANVRESDAPKMHLGDAVELRVLAYPGRVFKARITFVAPSLDPATRRLPVRAEVENADGALKPEMFASFSIITGTDVAAPGVPQQAIVYEGDDAHVWVAREDGTVVARMIRPGRMSEGMVEVTAGLAPGEKVVKSGTLFIDRAARGD